MWQHIQPIVDRVAQTLKVFQKNFKEPAFCSWDWRSVPGNKMVLMISLIRILLRLVLNWKFLVVISRFFATLSAIGCMSLGTWIPWVFSRIFYACHSIANQDTRGMLVRTLNSWWMRFWIFAWGKSDGVNTCDTAKNCGLFYRALLQKRPMNALLHIRVRQEQVWIHVIRRVSTCDFMRRVWYGAWGKSKCEYMRASVNTCDFMHKIVDTSVSCSCLTRIACWACEYMWYGIKLWIHQ